jgi:hypothetical protein
MAQAKQGPTQVSPSTVIALSAARLLNNVPLGWADVSHDSPKAIISRHCRPAQILPHPS